MFNPGYFWTPKTRTTQTLCLNDQALRVECQTPGMYHAYFNDRLIASGCDERKIKDILVARAKAVVNNKPLTFYPNGQLTPHTSLGSLKWKLIL